MAKNSDRASASRSSTSAWSRSKTNGFSTSSGKPARMTWSVGSKWLSLARQSETRAGRSRSSISARSAYGVVPTSLALAAARSGVLPTTAQRSTSGRSAYTRACSRPHHGPVPTTATLVRRSCVTAPPPVRVATRRPGDDAVGGVAKAGSGYSPACQTTHSRLRLAVAPPPAGGPVGSVGEQLGPFGAGEGAAGHRAGLLLPVVEVHVPQERGAAVVDGDEAVAAGSEGRDVGARPVLVPGQRASDLAQGGDVPQSDLLVGVGDGQQPVLRAERHRAGEEGLGQPAREPGVGDVPARDHPLARSADSEQRAVRRVRQGDDPAGVCLQGPDLLSAGGPPEDGLPLATARGQRAPVRAPRHRHRPLLVRGGMAEMPHRPAGGGVPDDRLEVVEAAGRQLRSP